MLQNVMFFVSRDEYSLKPEAFSHHSGFHRLFLPPSTSLPPFFSTTPGVAAAPTTLQLMKAIVLDESFGFLSLFTLVSSPSLSQVGAALVFSYLFHSHQIIFPGFPFIKFVYLFRNIFNSAIIQITPLSNRIIRICFGN